MGNENCSQLWYIFPFSFSAIVAVCANLCFGVHSSLKLKIGNAEKKQSKEIWLGMCAISLFAMPHRSHSKHRKIKKTCQRQSGDLTTL